MGCIEEQDKNMDISSKQINKFLETIVQSLIVLHMQSGAYECIYNLNFKNAGFT